MNNAKDQAKAQFDSIIELLNAHKVAEKEAMKDDEGKEDDTENTREAILNNALEVLVRSNWTSPSMRDDIEFSEFNILLCTGGPAVRIIGTLDMNNEPETAQLEYQDWGTPWTRYDLSSEETDMLVEYAGYFYFNA